MTQNFTSPIESSDDSLGSSPPPEWQTVIALFEDTLDARQAMLRLRKSGLGAETVSALIRDRKANEGGPSERHGAVARAVTAAELEVVSDWLAGLASVVIPERGTYLVAGPVGATLAGIPANDDGATHDEDSCPSTILSILEKFGFGSDEAAYVDSRLISGSMLLAVTSRLTEEQQVARESFARENAVYLGLAHTADAVVDAAAELLGAPPEASSDGDVVVMDAVARLYRLLETDRADARWKELCGRPVVDPDGDEAANVVEFIAESVPVDGSQAPSDEIRYVIVAYGGVLGIGRRQTVLPINQVDLESNPARVSVSKETLHRAPHYNHTAPFSRREEHAICAYFGTTPYWSDATSP